MSINTHEWEAALQRARELNVEAKARFDIAAREMKAASEQYDKTSSMKHRLETLDAEYRALCGQSGK